jgi:hypothetical protein
MPPIAVEIYQSVREICCLGLQGLKWRHQYSATLKTKCAQYDITQNYVHGMKARYNGEEGEAYVGRVCDQS